MRLSLPATMLLLIAVPLQAQDKPATPELKTTKQKVSYGIGLNIGRQFKAQGIDVDTNVLAMAIATVLSDGEPALSQEEIQAAFKVMQAEQEKARMQPATDILAEAKTFLTENAKVKGMQRTKTGLQYLVVKEGNGKTPKLEDSVTAHYKGTFIDGKVFDGSYEGKEPTKTDQPAPFPVSGVIDGWTEALQLMKVGAKYRLFIPPHLAYGEEGRPGIEPNKMLIFDIELVSVQ